MSTDLGPVSPRPESADLWRLPDILDAQIRRRHFDPPFRLTVSGVDREVRDGIEVEVRLSEPFAIRALGPVLWVGDEPLTIAESDGKTTYRFLAFDPDKLQPGARLSLSWNSAQAPRQETQFYYARPNR